MTKKLAHDNLIFRTVAGSHLYGTNGPDSDQDFLGIMVEPPAYVLGMKTFENWVSGSSDGKNGPEDTDETVYSLRKWARLATAGNPNLVLLLFTPESMATRWSDLWDNIVYSRDIFLSKQLANPFLGYMVSQRKALEGERGAKVHRPDLVEQFGYDTKFAMHYLRLGMQGTDLLREGTTSLPMSDGDRDTLLKVRNGEIPLYHVLEMGAELEEELRHPEQSDLADRPNEDYINNLLIETHLRFWRENA